MLVIGNKIMKKAHLGKYAVGAFNFNFMEQLQAIISGAEKLKSPVIIQTTEGALKYAGIDYLAALGKLAAKKAKVPVTLHLDHGQELSNVRACLRAGYTSIMYDGSHYNFEQNIRMTRKAVNLAHKKGVSVEAELGTIGGVEDLVSSKKIIYTEPDTAVEFVKRTGCDYLAIAIGTSHGAYKFPGRAKLDISRLKEIKKRLKLPLVLHGASAIPGYVTSVVKRSGGNVSHMHGVGDAELGRAVRNGINKVNTDSDLRLAFAGSVRRELKKNPKLFDPRKIVGPAREFMQRVVEHRITVCRSKGKAKF